MPYASFEPRILCLRLFVLFNNYLLQKATGFVEAVEDHSLSVWTHVRLVTMTWDEQLFALFDDLEQQATGLFQAERDAEIADRGQMEYATVTLASRLMASIDHSIVLEVVGVGSVSGTLLRVSREWCLMSGHGQEWIIRLAAICQVRGASARSVAEIAWSPMSRLGLGSALRRIVAARERCLLHLLDGSRHDVHPERVGADFVEVAAGDNTPALFAFSTLSAVQKRD
jgi:hypothetical protein